MADVRLSPHPQVTLEPTTPPPDPPERRSLVVPLVALLLVVMAVGAVVVGLRWRTDPPSGAETLVTTDGTPPFSGTDISSGAPVALDDFRGRPTLVVFWAHWCPFCQRELPTVQEIWADAGERFNVVTASVEIGRQAATVDYADPATFVRTTGMTMPSVADTSGRLQSAWKVTSFPTMFVLDADGNVVDAFEGARPRAEITAALERARGT